MVISRSDAEERIAKDDGDADDTVLVLGKTHRCAYHTDRECGALLRDDDRDIHETTRGDAQAGCRPHCRRCVLDGATANEGAGNNPEQQFGELIAAERKQVRRDRGRRARGRTDRG